ncbi:hypothetical protein, partial [Demequina sp.]|uniref:hypothetical protein n=1 Tax=Demequina sp. TaxID=2050685 RepID=UPI003A8B5924
TGLTLVNDLPQPWQVQVRTRVVDEAGQVFHEQHQHVTVAADGHLVIEPESVPAGAAAVVVDADGLRGVRWVLPDLELAHPTAILSVDSVSGDGATATVAITAHTLVRDLALLAETHPNLPDAIVDHQLLTLLPGEGVNMTVTDPAVPALDGAAWAALLAAGTALEVRIAGE